MQRLLQVRESLQQRLVLLANLIEASAQDVNVREKCMKLLNKELVGLFGTLLLSMLHDNWLFGQNETLREQFYRDAPQGWKRLQEGLRHLEGKGDFVQNVKDPDGKQSTHTKTWDFKINGDQVVWQEIWSNADAREETAWGTNSDYSFSIKRNRAGGSWILRRIGGVSSASSFELEHPTTRAEFVGFLTSLNASWRIGGFLSMPEIIREPGFKLTNIEETSYEGQSCVRIQFKYEPPKNGVPFILDVRGATAVLAPGQSWAVREYDVQMVGGTEKGRLEYQICQNGIPIVRTHFSDSANKKNAIHTETSYTQCQYAEVPDADFRLSAFGLPEPMGMPELPRPTRSYLWFGVAAFAALAIGLAFRKLAHRLRPSTT